MPSNRRAIQRRNPKRRETAKENPRTETLVALGLIAAGAIVTYAAWPTAPSTTTTSTATPSTGSGQVVGLGVGAAGAGVGVLLAPNHPIIGGAIGSLLALPVIVFIALSMSSGQA